MSFPTTWTLGALRAAVAVLSLAACDGASPSTAVPVDPGPETPIDLGLEPARPRRRMDVEQLDRSIERATGRRWMSGTTALFESNARTLGVPDYAMTTSEDLEVSALFVKFVDDAARAVCTSLVSEDADAAAADRIFFVHAEPTAALPADAAAIDENLSYLLLRYHGRRVEDGAADLSVWHDLYADARAAAGDGADAGEIAWRTVCVALIDHPDFYTY
jgi:hypothetical protein